MSPKLTTILDEDVTDPKERHDLIVACSLSSAQLNEAEETVYGSGCGPVGGGELLARVLEDPSHIDSEIMEFTRGAFTEATQRGISVQRYEMTCDEEIHAFGADKVLKHNTKYPEKKRSYIGFINGLCSDFREAEFPEGQRLFGVFATPLKDKTSHADIFVIIKPNKLQKAAIQQVFHDAFKLEKLIACPS
ncbi:hypothetical protein [Pseudomonas sp. W5-36]|uniref:hypothetical protein n=1 Tax=Pseudomonas sp. W5-36 TaxID=3097455 RepID=UPI00397B1ADB